ncbi:hypothetical protein CEXT_563831 [Caerostris extrusa]|uniref:Uncharacterized protein n=1 Tax=Caerostris extrusa TaxID=172846 RepID=A0AAV4PJA1_CAEEX|nr:hypothetical protein CEXT_563831 [Caerostris extrusa]
MQLLDGIGGRDIECEGLLKIEIEDVQHGQAIPNGQRPPFLEMLVDLKGKAVIVIRRRSIGTLFRLTLRIRPNIEWRLAWNKGPWEAVHVQSDNTPRMSGGSVKNWKKGIYPPRLCLKGSDIIYYSAESPDL